MLVFRFALVMLVVITAGPVFTLIASTNPVDVITAFQREAAYSALRTSFTASLAALGLATILGVPAAFALAHARQRTRGVLLFVLALPIAFPPITSGIMLLRAFGASSALGAWLTRHNLSFVDSLGGVALAEFFVSGAFVVIASTAAFSFIDGALEESAATLGASQWMIFRRIALPLAMPGIIAGMLIAWLRSIGEYGATSILAYHPASLSIYVANVLTAEGLRAALPLTYAFVVLAAIVVAAQTMLPRRIR